MCFQQLAGVIPSDMEKEKPKREVLHRQAREMVYKVHQYFVNEAREMKCPTCATDNSVARTQVRTAKACGIGLRTVQKIISEGKISLNNSGTISLKSPGKHRNRSKEVTELDDFNKNVLRNKIFDMYNNGQFPTAEKLVLEMKNSIGFQGGCWSMLKILKSMGFKHRKSNDGRRFLLERSDIVAARMRFLREMHEIRQAGSSQIYYLDETWVNQNHSRSRCWKMSDGSGGLKVPIGKGSRLIVCHAGSAVSGFIPQSKLIFRSKSKCKSSDYHSEMTAAVFRKWFEEQLLPYLEVNSVIVMDNASIHSLIVDKSPCSNTRKSDIVAWLANKNIPHSSLETRAELLQLVKQNKPLCNKYEIDTIAMQHGHKVVRLPPYHCQYNPIELVWAQVKDYVASRNNTFKLCDVEKLTHEAIDSISIAAWADCVKHAERLQEEDYRREVAADSVMEPIIININETDSESTDSSEEDE